MKKIFFILPELATGGVEKNVLNFSNYVSNLDIKISIIYQRSADSSFQKKFNSNISFIKIKNVRLLKQIFQYRKIIKEHEPDLVINSMLFVHFVLILSNLLLPKKAKIFLRIETNLKQDIVHKNKSLEKILFMLFGKIFIRLSDRVICSSKELYNNIREEYFKNTSNKLFLNYNPIIKSHHIPQFNFMPSHKFFNGQNKVFIAVGRLNTEKGFAELIELFSKIIKETNLTGTKLLIIGEGGLYKSLRESINRFSMQEFIDIIKFNDDFERYLFFSHAFICNSVYEGFNNNIVHALNMGLAVISKDCDFGPREILKNKEYGLLVENNKQMKEEILLQSEKDKIFNMSAFKRSLDFSVKSSSQNFLKIIDEC